MSVPSSETAHQIKIVPFHPTASDNAANPYDESAEPTYVAKLRIPETSEMFPKGLNFPGTKHISKRFIPCIHPTTSVEQSTESTGLAPENSESIPDAAADAAKNIPESSSSLCTNFPYSARVREKLTILKIGRITPVSIETDVPRENVSPIYDGIHVVTPSRSVP